MELSDLTRLNGVSGDESRVRAAILSEARLWCDDVRVDRMGNVLAFARGTATGAPHALLAAHMDEVGLIVRGIRDDGLIVYETVGAIDPRVMISKRVCVGADQVPGVIGYKAPHLQPREEWNKPVSHKKLYIDIGAADKAAAEKLVRPGDYVAFENDYVPFGEGFVRSKALDDRIGCYNLLRLMQKRYPCDVTYAFTVQEEVGLRGAGVAARGTAATVALVLEGTTANDLGMIEPHLQVCRAGHGVAISFMDRTAIAHPGLNRTLKALAQRQGIAWQIKTFVAGGNDAGAIQTARGAIAVCPISVPCRYIHSPASVCHLADVQAQYELAEAFLRNGAAYEQEDDPA